MSYSGTKLTALQAFETGYASFQQMNYQQAIDELLIAEDLFRQFDSRGHPFTHPLPNGISGLANTLALTGLCHQKLGNYRMAARCYETSFLNSKFEKRWPFRKFIKTTGENLRVCYEKIVETIPMQRMTEIRTGDPSVDTVYRFPFSLDEDSFLPARLYELSPKRYKNFRQFYLRVKAKDAGIRKLEKKTDETSMKKLSITIWGILIVIWAIYGLFVLNILLKK